MGKLPHATAEALDLDPRQLQRAYDLLEQWTQGPDAPVPAATMIVGRRGRVVAPRFFGRQGPEPDAPPLRPDGMFLMASITKPVTCLAALMLVERGASFGYNNLVSDMRSLAIMRQTGCPVVYDATHSVQLPGQRGSASGGQREFVPVLARAAIAAGVAGVFMETHPDPSKALSDGPNLWPLSRMEELLSVVVELDRVVKKQPYAEGL